MKQLIKKIFRIIGYDIALSKRYISTSTEDLERLRNVYTKYKPLKIHFGCGPRVLKGWVNIDLFYESYSGYLDSLTDEYFGVDIRGTKEDFFGLDATKVLPLPDSSVDVIFHEDFLEHLSQRNQFIFMAESFRVLKKGGIHRVNTPDLTKSLNKYSDFSKGSVGVYTDEWDRHEHVSVLTKNALAEMAKIVGYSDVHFNSRDSSICEYIPREYRPGKDRGSQDNIFADLIK